MMRNRKKKANLNDSEMNSMLGGTDQVRKKRPPVGIGGPFALKGNQDLNPAIGKKHLNAIKPISGV